MARNNFYNRASHSVVVDGFAVEDFFEGEAIAVDLDGDAASGTQGLDKNSISFNSQRIATLTLLLKPTSPSISRLQELANGPLNGNPRLIDVTISTGVNDKFKGKSGAVDEKGFDTGGANMTARTFTVKFEAYEMGE